MCSMQMVISREAKGVRVRVETSGGRRVRQRYGILLSAGCLPHPVPRNDIQWVPDYGRHFTKSVDQHQDICFERLLNSNEAVPTPIERLGIDTAAISVEKRSTF